MGSSIEELWGSVKKWGGRTQLRSRGRSDKRNVVWGAQLRSRGRSDERSVTGGALGRVCSAVTHWLLPEWSFWRQHSGSGSSVQEAGR